MGHSLHTQNFKVQVPKGTPLVNVFEILSRNGFHGLKMVLSCPEGAIQLGRVFSDLS
jgi:hypothetical protein